MGETHTATAEAAQDVSQQSEGLKRLKEKHLWNPFAKKEPGHVSPHGDAGTSKEAELHHQEGAGPAGESADPGTSGLSPRSIKAKLHVGSRPLPLSCVKGRPLVKDSKKKHDENAPHEGAEEDEKAGKAGTTAPEASPSSPQQPGQGEPKKRDGSVSSGRNPLALPFRQWAANTNKPKGSGKAGGAKGSGGAWDYESQGADWGTVIDASCTYTRQSPIDINVAMLKRNTESASKDEPEDADCCGGGPQGAGGRSPCSGVNRMLIADGDEMKIKCMLPIEAIKDYELHFRRGMKLEFQPPTKAPGNTKVQPSGGGGKDSNASLSPFGSFLVDQKQYDVVQFHFHQPAEHTFAGERRALELHIVSKHADNDLVVIGVTFESPKEGGEEVESPFLKTILQAVHALKPHMVPPEALAKKGGRGSKLGMAPPNSLDALISIVASNVEAHVDMMHEVHEAAISRRKAAKAKEAKRSGDKESGERGDDSGQQKQPRDEERPSLIPPAHPEHERLPALNLRDALPDGAKVFYRYNGSLTTPPCSEAVLWYVLKDPMPASKSELEALRELFVVPGCNSKGNYRRAQNAEGVACNQETIYVINQDI
ncbi:carbonate eukaryotic-type domain-containing protein [Cystoisospora suis]|uniref:carbonic anhydrase n=1 Tax=Cystoisospora suis TaxID=483139 RepID=A0A2C6L078_9APIC|nr:carbonate eukaryotic-type domain-containing protein [Cystoisospora suis]